MNMENQLDIPIVVNKSIDLPKINGHLRGSSIINDSST